MCDRELFMKTFRCVFERREKKLEQREEKRDFRAIFNEIWDGKFAKIKFKEFLKLKFVFLIFLNEE